MSMGNNWLVDTLWLNETEWEYFLLFFLFFLLFYIFILLLISIINMWIFIILYESNVLLKYHNLNSMDFAIVNLFIWINLRIYLI